MGDADRPTSPANSASEPRRPSSQASDDARGKGDGSSGGGRGRGYPRGGRGANGNTSRQNSYSNKPGTGRRPSGSGGPAPRKRSEPGAGDADANEGGDVRSDNEEQEERGGEEGRRPRDNKERRDTKNKAAMAAAARPQHHPYPKSQGSARPGGPSQGPSSNPLAHNARVVEMGAGPRRVRILCVTHVQGRLGLLCNLIRNVQPTCVINAGNFGFFDEKSYDTIKARELRARIESSHVYALTDQDKHRVLSMNDTELRKFMKKRLLFSELPQFLSGDERLPVPVYTIWGQYEDVHVVEKFRTGEYRVENLFLLDEKHSFKIPNTDIRLLGLGGNVVYHWLFDNGSGETTIAGDSGKMWATLQQIAHLVDTSARTHDERETRVFVSFVSPGREPLLSQIAHKIGADFSVSGHLHARYCVSFNDWAVNKAENSEEVRQQRLEATRAEIFKYHDEVKEHIDKYCTEEERANFAKALGVLSDPAPVDDYRTLWSVSLPDMDVGYALLNVINGKVGIETYSEGRDFSNRRRGEKKPPRAFKTQQSQDTPSETKPPRAAGPKDGPRIPKQRAQATK